MFKAAVQGLQEDSDQRLKRRNRHVLVGMIRILSGSGGNRWKTVGGKLTNLEKCYPAQ